MAVSQYDVGDRVRVSAVFRDLTGATADPTTVVAKYKDPSGNITTKTYVSDPEVTRDSLGGFHLDIDVDEDGTWTYRWNGTGAVVAAGETTFVAKPTAFP